MTIPRSHARRWAAGKRWPQPWRSIARGACLLAGVLMAAGCAAIMPQPPTTSPAPNSPPQAPVGSLPLDQIQSVPADSEFHATATDRQRFQVHVDFGRVFETRGNFDAAVLEYQEALNVAASRRRGSLGPADEALAHRRMGGALDRLGRFAQAENHYKQALSLSPKDARAWNDIGYSYYLQGRWSEAEGALATAARLAPDDNRIRTNLGLAVAAAGRPAEALPLLSQSSGDAVGHANLGYLLAATGQFDLAQSQYETALAMRPDFEIARRALARIALQQHHGEAAIAAHGLTAQIVPPAVPPRDASVKAVPPPRLPVLPRAPGDARAASAGVTAQLVLPAPVPVRTAAMPRISIPPPATLTLAANAPWSLEAASRSFDAKVQPASATRVRIPPPVPKRLAAQTGAPGSLANATMPAAGTAR